MSERRTFPPVAEQMDIIRENAEEILPEEELVRKLERSYEKGIPLNVKLGCDPTSPDLHVGHSVVLTKLRQFQDLGHQAILIIGDFTAMIGDPSGRSKTRPPLSLEEARKRGQTYYEQASIILRSDRLRIVYNSEWLGKMTFDEVIRLTAHYTVAQMLEREDFAKRYKAGVPIGLHEFLYPLAQAMDSVAIRADVELGGTDQRFNLLVGRTIQEKYGQEPQVILTMPLLEGLDGREKMSKSLGNYIALTDPPEEMFGKVMSIPDELILKYYRLAVFAPAEQVAHLEKQLKEQRINPRDAKFQVAKALVRRYYGEEAAEAAAAHFERVFVKKAIPDDIPTVTVAPGTTVGLVELLTQHQLAASKSEARRLIQQRAVSVDGEKIVDIHATITVEHPVVIKVGKRRFLKLQPSA